MFSLTVCNRAIHTCPGRITIIISTSVDYVSRSDSDSPPAGTAAGPGVSPTATEGLLQDIGRIMQPVACYRPQLNVIPLLSFASWSIGKHKNSTLAQSSKTFAVSWLTELSRLLTAGRLRPVLCVDKVAQLDVQTLLYDPQDLDAANALSRQLYHVREISHLPPLALTLIGRPLPMSA